MLSPEDFFTFKKEKRKVGNKVSALVRLTY